MTEKKHTVYWICINNSLRVSSSHPPTQLISCPSSRQLLQFLKLLSGFIPTIVRGSLIVHIFSYKLLWLNNLFKPKRRCLCYATVSSFAKRYMKVSMSTWWTWLWPGQDKFDYLRIFHAVCLNRIEIFCSFMCSAKTKTLLLKGKFYTKFSVSTRNSWCSSCKGYLFNQLKPFEAHPSNLSHVCYGFFTSSKQWSLNPRVWFFKQLAPWNH